jgi:hypothetical protein
MWVSSWANGIELVFAKGIEQSTRHGHGILAFAQSRGVGIERGGLDDLQRWHRKPTRDAQVLQRVVELGRLPSRHAAGAGGPPNQLLVGKVGNHEPEGGREQGNRPGAGELIDRCVHNLLCRTAQQCAAEQQQREQQRIQQQHKGREQKQRANPVRLDVSIKSERPQHLLAISKLHGRDGVGGLALIRIEVEERLRSKARGRSEQHRRKAPARGIVFGRRIVEEAAGGGNLVFKVCQLALQLLKVSLALRSG